MHLLTLGINHTTAPVQVRELVAISDQNLHTALQNLIGVPQVDEALIISTCNRTELYCNVTHAQEGRQGILGWLNAFHGLSSEHTTPYLYDYRDRSAVRHIFRVACGLDSMVLGEPQILGQLKSAYQGASRAGTLGRNLNQLFQHAFSVAKKVRTHTEIGANPVSVASAAVSLSKKIFGKLTHQSALLIGAGETIELAAEHLKTAGIHKITVANRSIERAQKIADRVGGRGVGLGFVNDILPESEIVITATASTLPILGKGLVERALKERRHKPIFMVDLAVPRDIEPEVAQLSDVYLYTIDDLHDVIEHNLQSRKNAVKAAEEMIAGEVEVFSLWQRGQDAVDTVRAFRNKAELQRDSMLEKANKMLEQGKSTDEVLQYLAYTLTNKFMHDPTEALNLAAKQGKNELIDAARILLNIAPEDTDAF
ncbi:MAG: glutamyl-tRNA reductase [Gammaproteobacteria bacterium]|nr:glutamyl-tRNA reductase [Gammaproteobacteria bacterium]